MKVGDQFSSYEDFEKALAVYKASVYNEFWIRDARTLSNQRKRFPDTVNHCNESLKYYHIRLPCVKGGRPFQSKNDKSSRKAKTLKQDCQDSIFLRLSKCQKYLTLEELKDQHNHSSSKTYFTSLSQQRLKLPETLKQETKQLTKFGANKKLVLDQIQVETGCKTTLKDLTNLGKRSEKKTFEDCISILKEEYKCKCVEVLVDDNGVFKGLYFQDQRMQLYFEAYPEILFADGTYCLVDLRTATYILMIEDGNGLSEIVAVCLLCEENEDALNFFIETFKKYNPSWANIKVVMSDKDRTERKVFGKHFPDTKLMICLFHVFQIFNREVSSKKMGITLDEVNKSKTYLQRLTYAKSEEEYQNIYCEMCENVAHVVKEYFDANWAPIKEECVMCYTFKNLCLSNSTNNRLENLNSKLKSVISRYSPLEDFIKHMFAYINSYRTGKDVKLSQELNKRSAQQIEPGSPKQLYSNLLTVFAYHKVAEQLTLMNSCKDLTSIQETTFLAATSEGLLQVTPTKCECLFYSANKLPCRHIFKCRQNLSLNLFDENLCLKRWTRSYAEKILFNCDTLNSEFTENDCPTEAIIKKTDTNIPKTLSNHRKFKIMDEYCKSMAKLGSEVSTPVFLKRVNLIQSIIKLWSHGKDDLLNKHIDTLNEEINQFVTTPTKTTETGHSIDIPAECTVTVDVQVHQSTFKEADSIDKENDPRTIQKTRQMNKENESNRQRPDLFANLIKHKKEEIVEQKVEEIVEHKEELVEYKEEEIEKHKKDQVIEHKEVEYSKERIEKKDGERIMDLIETNEDYLEEEYLEDVYLEKEEYLDQEYLEENFETDLPLLKDVIMPPVIRKRGRPKGCGNTVIGLKRRK